MEPETKNFLKIISTVVIILLILFSIASWISPHYQVFSQRLHGEAKLAEAESSRRVQIEDAKGKKEAATLLAGAEIERAKGVAEANRIIGESLKDNESYLRYLWIQNLHEGSNQVIYVPTEASLPILEASRHLKGK